MRTAPITRVASALFVCTVMMLTVPGQSGPQRNSCAAELIDQFKNEAVFWKQFEVAKKIVALHDPIVLPDLAPWLSHDDRHLRGNVAFVFGGLGDERGFEVISAILEDRSDRPEGQGQVTASDGRYHVAQQIRADRYYAVHLLGDLKDHRAVSILIQLLHDPEVKDIVPWALGEIGDHRAVQPLIGELSDEDPSMRVLAIYGLEKLRAREALPRLRELESDQEQSHFGDLVTVAAAAKAAVAKLEAMPR